MSDDVDDRYRRASALDPSRPSESVRAAVLRHAETLAAQRAAPNRGAEIDTARTARNRTWRRPAIVGTLAAAALAGLLVTPRFMSPREDSRHKAADSVVPQTPVADVARNSRQPSNPVADEMRAAAPAATTAPVAPAARAGAVTAAPAPPAAVPVAPAVPPAVANPIASEIQASRDDSAQRRTLRGLLRREPPDAQAGAQAASAAPDSLSAQVQSVTVTAARRSDAAAALRRAAQVGDMAALNGLLVPPSDVDARDDRGCTALMLATLHGQRAAVDALLAAGADPNAADAQGRTPLQAAVAAGQSDIIAALQRAGAH